ncbi:hypothetical protein MMC26_006255 [Xylographa opegraphella]|nr:hypothetical protein [Xylographa opegraphella]
MSSPISVGDLVLIVQLGSRIYEKCFTRAEAADQKYLQFGEEIRNFSKALEQLQKVLQHVEEERQLRPWLPYDAAQVRSTLKPLPDLTGDFVKTLKACEKLLSDNSKFRHNAAGFVDNVRWWLGVESEVELLKGRIRFHTTKILLITKPVEIQLLSDLRQDIWDVKRIVEEIRSIVDPIADHNVSLRKGPSVHLPSVPPELDRRFLAAFHSRPGGNVAVKDFPLKEGFDALIYHFGESTVNIPQEYLKQRTPELTQYLNLVKCRWILQKLMESSFFVHDSLWGRCIEDIETNILREFRRFDSGQLTSPNIEVIARLQEPCFSIWLDDHGTDVVPTLTDERPSEEKLLEIALPKLQGNRKALLVAFRKSDHELRLVHATRDDQNEMFYEAESHEIDLQFTRFIPLYAVPDSGPSTSTNNVLFCNRQGQGEKAYSLERLEDVHNLQQAVTGYKVGADLASVSWATFKTTENGKGRVQIWRAKPLPRMAVAEATGGQTQSPIAGHPRQGTSLSSFTLAESIAATAKGSLIYGAGGPAVLFSRPELPIVVVYTIFKDRWTFLRFELNEKVYINLQSCFCKDCDAKRLCKRIIIESKGKLKIERHCADARDGINTWNLALLRKPSHPDADKALSFFIVKRMIFTFASPQDKLEFQTMFNNAQTLRKLDEKEYLSATSKR